MDLEGKMKTWLKKGRRSPRFIPIDRSIPREKPPWKPSREQKRLLLEILAEGSNGWVPNPTRMSHNCRHVLFRKGLLTFDTGSPHPHVWWVTVEGEEAVQS